MQNVSLFGKIIMTRIKKYIIEKIRKELQEGRSNINNLHGITGDNIEEHLILPNKQKYICEIGTEKLICEFWTVLEEDPKDKSGYKIFYDEEDNLFGLGIILINGTLMYLCHCGSFIEALNHM